jgi:hypothetical protein
LPSPHFAKVLAEVRLEVGNSDFLHDLIMVMSGHIVNSDGKLVW